MRISLCLSLLALFALAAAADVNVTGNWTGTFHTIAPNGETNDSPGVMNLKQDGNTISGSVGNGENERYEIRKGTIEGNKVVLDVVVDEFTYRAELLVDGDRLYGDALGKSASGEERRVKVDLKRAK